MENKEISHEKQGPKGLQVFGKGRSSNMSFSNFLCVFCHQHNTVLPISKKQSCFLIFFIKI